MNTAQLIEELEKTASELEQEALSFDTTKTASDNSELTTSYFEGLAKQLGL